MPSDPTRGDAIVPRRSRIVAVILGIALASRITGGKTGRFLGIPYDWRRPTVARTRARLWNPAEPRLFVPRVFGLGWDVNFARLLGRHPRA
jgi:uncharacterized membrane protein